MAVNACCGSVVCGAVRVSASSPFGCSSSCIPSSTQCQFGVVGRRHSSDLDRLRSAHSGNEVPFHRGTRQNVKRHRISIISAATNDLAAGAANTKVAPLTIKDAKIVAQPPEDKQLKIRVDIDGQATKRAFDTVLKDLAKHAPPVPGFRKAKGGKTSIVPLNLIYQLMGPKLVRKFVIEEIIKATLNDYVLKEGIKVKNELKTDQSSDELDTKFEPGKEFGFDATLDLADEPTQDSESVEEVTEIESQSQPLEAGV